MENTPEQQGTSYPRFRSDLVAQPLEEEGVRYVDVTDPTSGQTFRFYDVEYSIACAMDGARDVGNLAEWTMAELGIEASPEELVSVINTLADLGYLEGVEGNPSAVPEAMISSDTEAAETPVMTEGGNGQGWTDETAQEVSAAYDQAMEPPASREAVPTAVPHPNVAAVHRGEEDELDEAPEIELVPDEPSSANRAATVMATPPPPPLLGDTAPVAPVAPAKAAKHGDEAEQSFAGLLDDSPPTPPPPADPGAMPAAARSPRPADVPHHLDDEDPTQVPTAHVEDDEDDVSVDLSAHLALDKREVQEAVRSSRVHAIPPTPTELTAEESESARAIREASTPPVGPSPAGMLGEPPPIELTKPVQPERTPTQPQLDEPRVPPATQLPSRPPVSPPPRVRASRPIEPTRMPPPAKVPQKKSSALSVLLIVVLFAIGVVGIAYLFKDRIFGSDDYSSKPESTAQPTAHPGDTTKPGETASTPPEPTQAVKPAETPPAEKPAETPPAEKPASASHPTAVVRADGVAAGGKVILTAAATGQIAWIADKGASVEAGGPVAKLLGYARLEAKVKDGSERGGFYAKKLAEAQAKGDAAAIAAAQSKVDEKKEIVDDATKALEKLVIASPSAGKVKPLVAVGADVKEGSSVAEVSADSESAGGALHATFDVGADVGQYAEGKSVVVAAKSAPEKQFAAVVSKVDGGKVDVKLVSAGGATAAAGDEVVLLPAKK